MLKVVLKKKIESRFCCSNVEIELGSEIIEFAAEVEHMNRVVYLESAAN